MGGFLDVDTWSALESIATIAALGAGGMRFYVTRQRYPRALITKNFFHRALPDDRWLLHVDASIRNVGDVLLSVSRVETVVTRVAPLSKERIADVLAGHAPLDSTRPCEVQWFLVGQRIRRYEPGTAELEPGEEEHSGSTCASAGR